MSIAMRFHDEIFVKSPFLPYLLSILIFSRSTASVSFPLTSFPAYSTIAPCATGHLEWMFNTGWWHGCSSNLPLKSYGSCICAYRLSDVNDDLSVHFSADAECSTSGVYEAVTQLCTWCGVDLAKNGVGTATATGSGPTGMGWRMGRAEGWLTDAKQVPQHQGRQRHSCRHRQVRLLQAAAAVARLAVTVRSFPA